MKLMDALRQKFKTPEEAIAALGFNPAEIAMDEALASAETLAKARDIVAKLKTGMAQDADIRDLAALLDHFKPAAAVADGEGGEGGEKMEPPVDPVKSAMTGLDTPDNTQALQQIRDFVTGKLSDEDIAKLDELIGAAIQMPPPAAAQAPAAAPASPGAPGDPGAPPAPGGAPPAPGGAPAPGAHPSAPGAHLPAGHQPPPGGKPPTTAAGAPAAPSAPPHGGAPTAQHEDKKMSNPAMDAAIKEAAQAAAAAEAQKQKEIRDAERAVRPLIGEVTIAADSADEIYRAALKAKGVPNADTVHSSALPVLVDMLKSQRTAAPTAALDSKATSSYAERFPHAASIIGLTK